MVVATLSESGRPSIDLVARANYRDARTDFILEFVAGIVGFIVLGDNSITVGTGTHG